MIENIQERNDDDMKIEEDEIDEIIRKLMKRKINLQVKILEKKIMSLPAIVKLKFLKKACCIREKSFKMWRRMLFL